MTFDWDEVAFKSKKELRQLDAIFIAASRSISSKRLIQIIKEYLPLGNIVLGIAKEPYIIGFEQQPHFKSLLQSDVQAIADKVNASSPRKICFLQYAQKDAPFIYEKVPFKQVLLVNGSWHFSYHTRAEYYALVSNKQKFTMISPFVNEDEAKKYANTMASILHSLYSVDTQLPYTENETLALAQHVAKHSYDTSHQTGSVLARKDAKNYTVVLTAWNKVVPYETFALHFGAQREKHFSPPGDLNYYDTIHSEVMLILQAQKQGVDLQGTTLFINLLPCPTCARMICESDIAEIVYEKDHSSGYAVALLETAGKTVRRVVLRENAL